MQIKKITRVILDFFQNSPLRLIPKQRIAIGALLLLGAALLLHHSLLSRQILRLKTTRMEVSSQRKLLQRKQNISQDPGVLLKQIKEIENQFNQLKEKFINEDGLPDFFDSIREYANRTKNELISLDLKSLRPLNEEELAGKEIQGLSHYQILPFTIAIEGDYVGALLFFNKLEEEPYLLEVNNIRIESDKKNPAQVVLDAGFSLYVAKE
jgi:Tfp pilus assembly protein PilO